VVRAGAGVRAWLGGVTVTAVTATAIVVLAGCGARIANLPARGGATPAATASAKARTGAEPAAGSRAGAQAPRVAVTPSGCGTVAVAVAGAAQPELWGDAGLIRAAKRLLRVKSVR
jgi:hypothetical protein